MMGKSRIYKLLISKSTEEILREYKKFDEVCSREFYDYVLIELEKTVKGDNIEDLKKKYSIINSISDAITLIIFACKYNKVNILDYLLNDYTGGKILPTDTDVTGHNAFYYAIRSGNIELLDTLINKWPDNYFIKNSEKLDQILAKPYEELKLKLVPLPDKMEYFVENKLLNLRFLSKVQNSKGDSNMIKERIALVLENIKSLKTEQMNDTFLFIIKAIAQNIHILKMQLKSTYDRIPWEEMEFCLVGFISSHIKQQEINIFYLATLNKSKIMNHLENFAHNLNQETKLIECVNIKQLSKLPNLSREIVIANIVNMYPQFKELYNDYKEIKDVHSLEKIHNSIKLVLPVDHTENEGKVIIMRVLQVIGEYLKNTLESPKLSNSASELLLLTLPKNTRKIITDLRNSLSHAHSLAKRTEIEESTDVDFYVRIQNDIKKIDTVITDILFNKKIKIITMLLTKFINSENLEQVSEVCEVFFKIRFSDICQIDKFTTTNYVMMEHEKLEKLIKELSDVVKDKTSFEIMLFDKMNYILSTVNTKDDNINFRYLKGLLTLKSLSGTFSNSKVDKNLIRILKFQANKILESLSQHVEPHKLKQITEVSLKLSNILQLRMTDSDNVDTVKRLTFEIFNITEFSFNDIEQIQELKEKLNEKSPSINKNINYTIPKGTYLDLLIPKLSQLKNILRKYALDDKLFEKLSFYKNCQKLQTIVEMLSLDIMSILSKNILENNLCFLDDNTSLLTGKCLRNHLAHDNVLLDILLFDPSTAVILNAIKLVEDNLRIKETGKLVKDKPIISSRKRYNERLDIISKQEKMFKALEEGNFECLKDCIKEGTDIHARSYNSWTTLHFAAKGSNIEIVKYILDQNLSIDSKDINGQSPLHIAAAHGNKNIVEYFLKELCLRTDELDYNNKTPLHIAAQNGHKDTVQILLKYKANYTIRDTSGLSPLHIAISNNHVDIAKVLLEKDTNIDNNKSNGGYTSLHYAAECGLLKLVNFLLRNKANVNSRNDQGYTPLHGAALNGHLDIVKALISNGANVNVSVINGNTPLHNAAENSHRDIILVLLKYGANVNAIEKSCNFTPLHFTALSGNEEILQILLKNQADASIASVEGMTPLHFAAREGHLKIVTALIQYGVNINAEPNNNFTSLYIAAERGHKDVVEVLIKNGGKINTKNNFSSCIHLSSFKGHVAIVDLLIKNKAEVNARDINGNTPLHLAATSGNNVIIDLLIKNNGKVNIKNALDLTPLDLAAKNNHLDTIIFLIKNKANVHTTSSLADTPLCSAIKEGHIDVVNLLIKNQVEINTLDGKNIPILLAVETGHKDIVEILLKNGADANVKRNNITPLISAVRYNFKDIVEVLIANGANVNASGNEALLTAAFYGRRDIVKVLLKNNADYNSRDLENATPLHRAAREGHKNIVSDLIATGADINAVANNNITPLYLAAQKGHIGIVEILIAGGANVNIRSNELVTPLHIAATFGHSNVVKMLVDSEANINVKDANNRTPVELAVTHGHLQVVQMLFQYNTVDINDWTVLYIASKKNNLKMIKYLVDEGCNINARNDSGSKPIHIAAREGFKDIVDFFLAKKMSIDDTDASNQTLMHYAGIKGHVNVVNYLIEKGANVNAKDVNGLTPIHIAAQYGYKDVVAVLLKNSAVYNADDNFFRNTSTLVKNQAVIELLTATENLFKAVKLNNPKEVENYIKIGGSANAKNVEGVTPLNYAAWKGYDKITDILLCNDANPNVLDDKGWAPLHYASKLSIVKSLLASGAVYNAVSKCGKTPLELTKNKNISDLLKQVNKSFEYVKNGNAQIVNILKKIKDADVIKAIMRAQNKENKTLIVAAMLSNFIKAEELKEIFQDKISFQIQLGLLHLGNQNLKLASEIFKAAFEKRKEIFGLDNPATLDIQVLRAKELYVQGAYQKSLNLLQDIVEKQTAILGLNHKDTLKNRSFIALVLYRLRKDDDALKIFKDVYQQQIKTLEPNHSDTLETQFHMALTLDHLGKYDEALDINKRLLENRKKELGTNNSYVVRIQNNIAMVLGNQGKYEKAIKTYKDVLKQKKQLFGVHHSDTLRTSSNIANLLTRQQQFQEAIKLYEEVLKNQITVLGPNHPETLITEYNFASALLLDGRFVESLKAFTKCLPRISVVLGPDNPHCLLSSIQIKAINMCLDYKGTNALQVFQDLQKQVNIAASNGDLESVQRLINDGADVNDTDDDGRTALHFAVSSGEVSVVKALLSNGSDVTKTTNKGNTPLHVATSKGYNEIVDVLLHHINRNKLNNFINAKTFGTGSTSLHIASKNGFLTITKTLFHMGAIYNIKNNDDKTPHDVSGNQSVSELLIIVDEFFSDVENGNAAIFDKLARLRSDEYAAVLNARNNKGKTLLEAIFENQ